MTEDGAIFENDDPISVTFGDVISSTVLDWKLPHISKRYMEICKQLKSGKLFTSAETRILSKKIFYFQNHWNAFSQHWNLYKPHKN